jgi:phosphoglycolate phosphatase
VFDFDGTLADSFGWFGQVFDRVADRHGFRRMDQTKVDALRGMDARQIMRHQGVSSWKVPFIVRDVRRMMAADIGSISLFPGVDAALSRLAAAGIALAVVTSNARGNVAAVLGPRLLAHFTYLECGVSMFGKAGKLRKVLRASGTPARDAILIGDEIRDAQAAAAAAVAFGAVSWGYTLPAALQAQNPREVFASVEDLPAKLIAAGP